MVEVKVKEQRAERPQPKAMYLIMMVREALRVQSKYGMRILPHTFIMKELLLHPYILVREASG